MVTGLLQHLNPVNQQPLRDQNKEILSGSESQDNWVFFIFSAPGGRSFLERLDSSRHSRAEATDIMLW